ncbi:MAG: hypothetical protein M1820_007283 [Bogoriella megaspora]|nr:MAG: hypothetical protein M1820_007283 [Bogoriella megaspora]
MSTIEPESTKVTTLGLLSAFLKITLTLFTRLLTSPFHRTTGARTYRRDVSYAVLRTILSDLSAAESQSLTPSTSSIYHHISTSLHQTPLTIPLSHNAQGHWIGPPDAKYVLLYFHGGGYIGAASRGCMKWQFELISRMREELGVDMSIFTLSYTLAPEKKFPTQLGQAVQALRYLVEGKKRDPRTIVVGGDSAGGNLACALMMHLARPYPGGGVVEKLELGTGRRLRGCVLISPWCAFGTAEGSVERNGGRDHITVKALDRASGAFTGLGGGWDVYSHPSEAGVEFWREVADRAVEEVLIWGGGGEVLIDGIRKFAADVEEGFEMSAAAVAGSKSVDADGKGDGQEVKHRVKFVEGPEMAHEEMIIDRVLRIKERSEGDVEIEKWLKALL